MVKSGLVVGLMLFLAMDADATHAAIAMEEKDTLKGVPGVVVLAVVEDRALCGVSREKLTSDTGTLIRSAGIPVLEPKHDETDTLLVVTVETFLPHFRGKDGVPVAMTENACVFTSRVQVLQVAKLARVPDMKFSAPTWQGFSSGMGNGGTANKAVLEMVQTFIEEYRTVNPASR